MQKNVVVISLGGSQIIPDQVDKKYLLQLKRIILKNTKKYKFVIVCGGGSLARKYISAVDGDMKMKSLAGITATRANARFMNYFFGFEIKRGIPETMWAVKDYLKKQDIIFCGALEYHPDQTSDSTAAQIAKALKTKFINLTNVKGLYTKNPKKHKNAKFIPKISWQEFHDMANKTKFQPGQHFVLDQSASKIIMDNKISTYIVGLDTKQLDKILDHKKFTGTIIQD